MPTGQINAAFQLLGDQFPHAWFFNRFRCDRLGKSVLVTTALLSDNGATLAVNAFVLSNTDLLHNRDRSLTYLGNVAEDVQVDKSLTLTFAPPPERVYPVNHINLARMGDMAEFGLYRYSIHTLLLTTQDSTAKAISSKPILCYPVVMFRSDISVQLALLTELFSLTPK